jgi:hypothetical protein
MNLQGNLIGQGGGFGEGTPIVGRRGSFTVQADFAKALRDREEIKITTSWSMSRSRHASGRNNRRKHRTGPGT